MEDRIDMAEQQVQGHVHARGAQSVTKSPGSAGGSAFAQVIRGKCGRTG